MAVLFDPQPHPFADTIGGAKFPVRRIFCVGKNYAKHVQEMGGDSRKDTPVFFTKPADSLMPSGSEVPYPDECHDFHYEGELVLALKSGGRRIARNDARSHIYGFGAGCDLTRRDLQVQAKQRGTPWDSAKAFDCSAPLGPLTPIEAISNIETAELTLSVNGAQRQKTFLSAMIWPIEDIIASLSRFFELKAGDLIYTGTPEGVGPLAIGDQVEVCISELCPLKFRVIEAV